MQEARPLTLMTQPGFSQPGADAGRRQTIRPALTQPAHRTRRSWLSLDLPQFLLVQFQDVLVGDPAVLPRPSHERKLQAPVPQTAGASLRGLINLRQVVVRAMVMVPCRHHLSFWKSGRSPGIHRPGFFYEQSLCGWVPRIGARANGSSPRYAPAPVPRSTQ
jgi:hypothetical protein